MSKPICKVIQVGPPMILLVAKNGRPVSLSVALTMAKKLYPEKKWKSFPEHRGWPGDNSRAVRGRLIEVVE